MFINLVNIELTNEDYDLFKTYKKDFSLEEVVDFVRMLASRYNLNCDMYEIPIDVRENIPNMINFYEIAMKRDEALIDNTLKRMEEEGKSKSVLIAGGFHTRGIKDLLKKKGVSYVVVTPKITKDVETPYIKVLTNQRTSLEDIITENAMPGVNAIAPAELATQPVVGYLISMSLNAPARLEELNNEMAPILEKVSGSRSPLEKAEETFQEMVDALISAKVDKWAEEADPEVWQKALEKKEEVIASFIHAYEAARAYVLYSNYSEEETKWIAERYDGRENLPAPLVDAIKEAFEKKWGSVGEYAMAITAGAPLNGPQVDLYDELLRESFSPNGRTKGWVKEDSIERAGLVIQVHSGIEERRAKKNDELLLQGQSIIPTIRIHPSTFRGQLQMHVSELVWSELSEQEKDIIANHERRHIRIFSKVGKAYELWQQYLKYAEKENIPLDQEDFIDRIQYWAGRLGEEINITASDFPNSDTREIRKKVASIYTNWIIAKVQKAIDNKDEEGMRKALTDAYILASEHENNDALVWIVNAAGRESENNEKLFRNAVYQVAEWFPFWLTSSYYEEADSNSKNLVKAWFNESEYSKEVSPKNIVSVIMAGGGGERLAPLSTSGTDESEPKQVAKIIDKRLVSMAVERVIGVLGAENVYIQTVPELKETIYQALKEVKDLYGKNVSRDNIFTEPYAADTAGAIGFAAAKLIRLGRGEDIMFVQTADHYVETNSGKFQKAYMLAAKVSKHNPVMGTIGIDMETIGASSEYGCIRSAFSTSYDGVTTVDSFKEKPPIEVAREMLEEGVTSYNSGMYIMRPSVILGLFNRYAPDYGEGLMMLTDPATTKATEESIFISMAKWKKEKQTPNGYVAGSIDNVLSEFLGDNLFVVTGEFAWKDIGGYGSIMEYYREDYSGEAKVYDGDRNIIVGEEFDGKYSPGVLTNSFDNVVVASNPNHITLNDCSNCLVLLRDKDVQITISGLKDSLVVYNPETKALLVAPISVEGKSIKEKFVATIEEKPELRGYTTGRAVDIKVADKLAVLYRQGKYNTKIYEYGTGVGLIKGSQDSQISVGIGLVAILDVQEQSVRIDMRPGTINPDSPEIFIGVREGDVRVPVNVTSRVGQLTSRERVGDFLRMIISGEMKIPDAEIYAQIYRIDDLTAKQEIKIIIETYDRYLKLKETISLPKFGTSGLRGRNEDLKDIIVYAVMKGMMKYFEELHTRTEEDIPSEFLSFIKEGGIETGVPIVLAGDNRPYSEQMLVAAATAILDNGNEVDYIGKVPTPTAAFYGLIQGYAMAMVTGSHIPITENGMKFDRVNGEVWKQEEQSIIASVKDVMNEEFLKTDEDSFFDIYGNFRPVKSMNQENAVIFEKAKKELEKVNPKAVESYENHFLNALGRSLEGVDILFGEHTAVGRDILPDILEKMGATITRVGRKDATKEFFTVDTENVKPEYLEWAKELLLKHKKKVLITTDGDSDRPAVFYLTDDGELHFITGDKLGVLAAMFLEPEFFVVPDTANESALNLLRDRGSKVETTNVGSPYVDEVIYSYNKGKQAVGCENNGGFFIGYSGFQLSNERIEWLKTLHADNADISGWFDGLSTRDALIPMILMLLEAKRQNKSVEQLVEDTFVGKYGGEQVSGLVENIDENTTPGCEMYTREMSAPIMDSFRVYDSEGTKYAESVMFEEEGVQYRYKKEKKTTTEDRGIVYDRAVGVKNTLENYLNSGSVFKDVGIRGLTYKTSGVKLYLDNGEIVVLRPSGNSAQFRIMATTPTIERSKEIVAAGTASNTGILVNIIRDFAAGVSPEEDIEPFVPTPERETLGQYSASAQGKMTSQIDLGQLTNRTLAIARNVYEGHFSERLAVEKVAEMIPQGAEAQVLAYVEYLDAEAGSSVLTGVNDKVFVNALRLMQFAVLARLPIKTSSYQALYDWGGNGNKALLGMTDMGGKPIAELWSNVTVKSERNPEAESRISGTALTGLTAAAVPGAGKDITLRDLLAGNSAMLGAEHKEKPGFVKSLSTRFPDVVYMGFNREIKNVGKVKFAEWLIEERKNMEKLKAALRRGITEEEFSNYLELYEDWSIFQGNNEWMLSPEDVRVKSIVEQMQKYMDPSVGLFIFEHIAKNRANIVSVLNEIELEDGMVLKSLAGYAHGIFGLSLQTHPKEVGMGVNGTMEYPKNEAWIIKTVRDINGNEYKVLIEPQQTSDNTHSIADLFTPIVWDAENAMPKMRKDVTEKDLKQWVDKDIFWDKDKVVANIDEFMLTPQDITPIEDAVNAKVESLIEPSDVLPGTDRITLNGEGDADKASVIIPEMPGIYQELLVLEGEVTITVNGVRETYSAFESMPVAASLGEYGIESTGYAEVLRTYYIEDAYEVLESVERFEDVDEAGIFNVEKRPAENIDTDEILFGEETTIVKVKSMGKEVLDTRVSAYSENVVFGVEDQVVDQINIVDGSFAAPAITEAREHTVEVVAGRVIIETSDGESFTLYPGARHTFATNNYTMKKTSMEPVTMNVQYEKTKQEELFYTVYKAVMDNMPEIQGVGKVDLFLPEAYFAKKGIGSTKWVENQLNGILGRDFLKISTHKDDVLDLSDLVDRNVRGGSIAILGATGNAFQKAVAKEDMALSAFLEQVRPMVLPSIGENYVEKADNMLPMLISSLGILQAAIGVEKIVNRENIALGVLRVMAQAMNRPNLKPEDLYNILSNIEIQQSLNPEALAKIQEQWGGLSVYNQAAYVMNYFGLKDIVPEDPREEWQNRQKVMWSV
ncbi:MAG: hypothetical protein KAI70_02050 [Candidatus Omnitrophica bacterium]|nr:hypothetical protein [Candidatus Omnitrophota bacterium]